MINIPIKSISVNLKLQSNIPVLFRREINHKFDIYKGIIMNRYFFNIIFCRLLLKRDDIVQLKLALNSSGDCCVFDLKNLLKDCGCSNPNSYAISLTERVEVDSLSLA